MPKDIATTDEFYIGWQEKAPSSFAKKSRMFMFILAPLVLVIAAILVLNQQGFAPSIFEFGSQRTVSGILVTKPVPMLKEVEGQKQQSWLLVGLGKNGATPTIEAILSQLSNPPSSQEIPITLKGTKITYQGKTALELTDGTKALVEIGKGSSGLSILKEDLGRVQLMGEILDPKCALGVMKPGYGKPHRSCAIRCISGGIPPLLRVSYGDGSADYVLLLGPSGESINLDLIPYIADQIQICGQLERQDDWLVLYTDPSNEIRRLAPFGMTAGSSQCGQP